MDYCRVFYAIFTYIEAASAVILASLEQPFTSTLYNILSKLKKKKIDKKKDIVSDKEPYFVISTIYSKGEKYYRIGQSDIDFILSVILRLYSCNQQYHS